MLPYPYHHFQSIDFLDYLWSDCASACHLSTQQRRLLVGWHDVEVFVIPTASFPAYNVMCLLWDTLLNVTVCCVLQIFWFFILLPSHPQRSWLRTAHMARGHITVLLGYFYAFLCFALAGPVSARGVLGFVVFLF